MKRIGCVLLSLALILGLCACGTPAGSSTAENTAALSVSMDVGPVEENSDGYVVPAGWTENSIDDGTWGYVIAESDLPSASAQGGCLFSQDYDEESQYTTLTRYTMDGQEVSVTDIPPMDVETEDVEAYCYANYACFTDDGIWLIRNQTIVLDPELGETEYTENLELWSYEGQQLSAIPLEDILLEDDNTAFIYDFALNPGGNPVFITERYIYFCNGAGTPIATQKIEDNHYSFCRDSSGRLYLTSFFENQVYTIDWDNHAVGEPLFSTTGTETVMPGGGDYDFFLESDTTLRGVSLNTGTITTILNWSDWDLTGCVGGVLYLDPDTFLISVYSLLGDSSQILTLSRVPADEIPEKTTVRLALALREDAASDGQTWADTLDQHVADAINQFNRSSGTYRVEVETYGSAEELNLNIISGDAPDIIDWNSTAWLDDTPSMALYAKKGYLTDLEPLFDQDPELSTDDFIPNILRLSKERTNGMYTAPLNFYFSTLSGPIEYVGEEPGWSVSDMLEVAKALPEDVILWDNTQKGMLDILLRTNINDFVDLTAGTCDFENQDFYDLMTLCRDYFPAEYSESGETGLLTGSASMGNLCQFAADVMVPLSEQGRVLIGYPGAGGSGVSIIFNDDMSICSLGAQQEGAWEFLRPLFTYDFQSNVMGVMCAVREDAFTDQEDRILANTEFCTREEALAARQLIYDADNVRVNDSPAVEIVSEEAEAFFSGDKSAEETARIIQNRVEIYLAEQS